MKFIETTLAITLLAMAATCYPTAQAEAQSIERWNKGCLRIYKQWQGKARHKAFAVSNSASNSYGQACGASWAAGSKAAAEKAALASCNKSKVGSCWVSKSE